jgi:hypothetical protein
VPLLGAISHNVQVLSAGAGLDEVEATQSNTLHLSSLAAGQLSLTGAALNTVGTDKTVRGAISLFGHSAHSIPQMGEATGQLLLQGAQTATLTDLGSTAMGTAAVDGVALAAVMLANSATGAVTLQGLHSPMLQDMLVIGSGDIAVVGQGNSFIDFTTDALGAVQASSFSLTSVQANLVYQLALLHGLVANHPLQVSSTTRSAGSLAQTVSGLETVTITTNSAPSLVGDVGSWIEALAALHGLTVPLVVSANKRSAGLINQAITQVGALTTVTRQ